VLGLNELIFDFMQLIMLQMNGMIENKKFDLFIQYNFFHFFAFVAFHN
jgi:hypothetical protein